MKQEFLTRNNLHRSRLYNQQSLSIFGGIFLRSNLPLRGRLSKSLSPFFTSLPDLLFHAQASTSSSSDREVHLFRPLFCGSWFHQRGKCLFLSRWSHINKSRSGLSIQAPRNLLHCIQCLVLFTKVQGLLSSYQQNYLAIFLLWELRIWDSYTLKNGMHFWSALIYTSFETRLVNFMWIRRFQQFCYYCQFYKIKRS